MRFHAEEGTESLTVAGQRYEVAEDGTFECDNTEHHAQLRQLGCYADGERHAAAPVEAAEPPAIPEGLVSEEAVRALIEENEDQKIAIDRLNGENEKLRGELSSAASVEEELRNRISELTGQLETATAGLSSATENATETQSGAEGGESTSGAGDAAETATEAAPATTGKRGK